MPNSSLNILAEETIALLPELMRLIRSTLAIQGEIAAIPLGQIRVMHHLYENSLCTVGEVASGLGVSLATASELIDRLVESGWVERRVNPADRRQVRLLLTTGAIHVGDQIREMRWAQVSSAFDRLSPEDQAPFVRGLRALVEALGDATHCDTNRPILVANS